MTQQADELTILNSLDAAIVGSSTVADEIIAIRQIDEILIVRATADELHVVD